MRKFLIKLNQSSIRNILALILIISGLAYLFIPMFHTVPGGNKELVAANNNSMIALLMLVSSYFFGASKDKTDADKQDKMTITNPNITASVTAPNTNDTAATK